MKLLIFTDSRGQHCPVGSIHEIFPVRLAKNPRLEVELFLAPYKWTTTLDFFEIINETDLSLYSLIVLYTGIVEWSPRPLRNAIDDIYNNAKPHNLNNLRFGNEEYGNKIVNNKKFLFDTIFGEEKMLEHLSRPFKVEYENSPTINMYSLEMAASKLIPRLQSIPNLLFINANRFVSNWNGDYWKKRPANIGITHSYADLFANSLPRHSVLDLRIWKDDEIKKYTCDNVHLNAEGSDYIYDKIMDRIEQKAKLFSPRPFPQRANRKPIITSPTSTSNQLRNTLTSTEISYCRATTLIIGVRLSGHDPSRISNLSFLLAWIEHYYGGLFDVILIEQDSTPKLNSALAKIPDGIRYEFIYNPDDYNRGWGYNVAVSHFCKAASVVVMLDTDILLGEGFLRNVIDCSIKYKVVSPYRNIYYTNEREAERIKQSFCYHGLCNDLAIKNPVTISGGILIIRRDIFMEISGFEQYIGYGCEDRALDVTLLNLLDPQDMFVSDETYVHLHHPADAGARSNFDGIYQHLSIFYSCQYDPSIDRFGYIHENCRHSPPQLTKLLSRLRQKDFGNLDLYCMGKSLTINGQLIDKDLEKTKPLLPKIHADFQQNELNKALFLCQIGIQRYGSNKNLLEVFVEKIKEIERAEGCLTESVLKNHPGSISLV